MNADLLKERFISAYDKEARNRDEYDVDDWKKDERDYYLSFLKDEGKKTLLEIGSGPGKDGVYFKKNGLNTLSIDLSPEMVKICREKGLRAEVMSFYDLELEPESFDAAWAMNCLLHVPKKDLPKILSNISDLLKPNGLFYMGVYGGKDSEGIWEEDTYRPKRFFSFFEFEKLKEVVSNVFDVEYFTIIPKEVIGRDLEFQGFILRKR